jgi:hypothetical protein
MKTSRRRLLEDALSVGAEVVGDFMGSLKSVVVPEKKKAHDPWVFIGHYREFPIGSGYAVNRGKQFLRCDEAGMRVEECVNKAIVNRPLKLDGAGKIWINISETWEKTMFLSHATGQMKLEEA